MPVVAAKSPLPEVVAAAAPAEEPVKLAVTSAGPQDSQTDRTALAAPNTSEASGPVLPPTRVEAEDSGIAAHGSEEPQPVLLPHVEAKDVAVAAAEKTDEVRVLRDAAGSDAGPNLTPDSATPVEPEVRRLPPPETAVGSAQPSERAIEGSDVVRQPLPSPVIPEPSVAVEPSPSVVESVSNAPGQAGKPDARQAPSPAVVETLLNPVRLVVPEPQQTAEQNSPPANRQPALTEPGTTMTADGAKPANSAKPANKADLAAPQASESAAAQPPMKAIGRAWEEPRQLLIQLEELKKHEITQAWATEALASRPQIGTGDLGWRTQRPRRFFSTWNNSRARRRRC